MKKIDKRDLIKLTVIILSAIAIAGCVKEYAVPGLKYNDMIVIDGILTDGGEAHVKISHTYNSATNRTSRCSGAEVTITDSDGRVYTLIEDKRDEGTYSGAPDEIKAQVGKSYQLKVTYEGTTYLSPMEEMLAVPEISGASFAYSDDNDGVWVNASMSGDNDGTRYFAWAYDETWKFQTPYITARLLDNHICYMTKTSKGILTATTESMTDNRLDNSRVYFISFDNDRLAMRYSTMLKLQSVSRNTYLYLEHAKELNVNNGSLFDPIPSSVNGNILSEDGTVAALGNFQVSAQSQKRLYIDYSELKRAQKVMWYSDICGLDTFDFSDTAHFKEMSGRGWAIMDTIFGSGGFPMFRRMSNFSYCFDCMSTGAPNVPPSWWEERPSPVK